MRRVLALALVGLLAACSSDGEPTAASTSTTSTTSLSNPTTTAVPERVAALADATARELNNGTGTPIVTAAGPRCRAEDLEALGDMGLQFLLVANRSGRPCSLVDHPAVLGRRAGGSWEPVLTQPSLGRSYSDGPTWNGLFDPRYTAVLSIRVPQLDPRIGYCPSGSTTPATYERVAIVVDPGSAPFELTTTLEVGECRPQVLLWSYDAAGEG